jgi:tetratricopeptide (TPR) repeat protein
LSATLDFTLPGKISVYHVAADMNMVGTLALLLERADKDTVLKMQNVQGYSPLDVASREGHVGCVLLLLPDENPTEEAARQYIEKAKAKKGDDCSVPSAPPVVESSVKDGGDNSDPVEVRAQKEATSIAASASKVTEDSKQKAQELKATGNSYFVKKDWDHALEFYTQAIESDPTDATFFSNRSACHLHLEKREEALFDAVVARHLRPEWPKAAYRMAVARLELGRFEDAAMSAWEGLQQDQENEELKLLLQKCVKKGRKDFIGIKKK